MIRVVAAMLDPSILEPVSHTNKKADMDQANNTYRVMMELVLELSKRHDLQIVCLDEMDMINPEGLFNPCGFDFRKAEFDIIWIEKSVKDYIKPKYNIIIGNKWFKETDGGKEKIANFGN